MWQRTWVLRKLWVKALIIKEIFNFQKFEKFTKVECSSSNKTCINPYCNLKAYSRKITFMNFGCDLLKPLTNTRFAVTSWMKSLAGSYRQFAKVDDIDMCNVLGHLKDYKNFQGQIDWLNTTFSGSVHACPYIVSKFSFFFIWFRKITNKINQSFKVANASMKQDDTAPRNGFLLPNGVYKVKYQGSDATDDNIFQLTFLFEVNYHFRVFDFK